MQEENDKVHENNGEMMHFEVQRIYSSVKIRNGKLMGKEKIR